MRATAAIIAALACASSRALVGFTPIAGYEATDLGITGSAIAISQTGKFAVAQDSPGGGATIQIYDRVPLGRTLLGTINSPIGDTWKFISALTWLDDDTLAIGESGDMDTAYSATLSTASRLAPIGSIPNIAGLRVGFSGDLFATASNNPGAGAVYRVTGGAATLFAGGLGNGYLGGLEFGGGHLLVADSNDPFFLGNPGQVLSLDSAGSPAGTSSLSGGGGSGLVDLALDSEGDLFATTGATLTMNGSNFGFFDGFFPFPTFLAYHGNRFEPGDGDGMLVVNGAFTNVGGIFAIQPVPEPMFLTAFGLALLLARRRK